MDITIHNIIKQQDIKLECIEHMPSKITYYSFAVLVSQIIRRHHNIVSEINSYRGRIKEIKDSITLGADISEFDVLDINDIKRSLVEAFNKFRLSEKQVKMYVLLYNTINKCYDKCVSWCKGLSKDDIMKMVFAGTGIEIIETVSDRYQRSMNNTQADIKANTAAANYDKMFQFIEDKKLKLKTDEQDQSYRVSPEIYDKEMKDNINTFISIYINTGVLNNLFYDDTEEIIKRVEGEKKASLELLKKQTEEEKKELENDEIMQILNLSDNKIDNKAEIETPANISESVNKPKLKQDINNTEHYISSSLISSSPQYVTVPDNSSKLKYTVDYTDNIDVDIGNKIDSS